jgi:hypothetical protein
MESKPDFQNSATPAGPGRVVTPGAAPSVPAVDRPIGVASPASLPPEPSSPTEPASSKRNWAKPFKSIKNKKILVPAAAALIFIGGSAGAYYGYFVPNQPANVWRTALTNTGKGYDKLSSYAQTQFGGQSKGVKLNGSFKVSGSVAADGDIQGSSDSNNGEFTGSFSASGLKVGFDTRIIKSGSNTSPDIYFKVDGVQGLGDLLGFGDPKAQQDLNSLNGNWYFIDHTLFEQYAQGANASLQFSQADVKSVLDAVGAAAKQNIFTNDPSKMAFTVKQQIGKEKQDGRSVYHYKVGIDKANLKTFVTSLCNNLKNSSLKKIFNNDSQSLNASLGCSAATKSADSFSSSRTADVWVDLHTKLIHKIRFTDPDNSGNYLDVGQDYQGGDNFPFDLAFQDKSNGRTSSGNLNITLDTKTNTLNLNGSARESGSNGMNGSLNLTVSPNSSEVKVDKPANAKNIIQLLNDLGFGDVFGQVQSSAKDTERKTDINALQGQLEAYYAENGYYPTLASLNDPNWRAKNLKGLDSEALKDPDGTSTSLSAKPVKGGYSYAVSPSGCDNGTHGNCNDYTLTATLDDGSTYAKQSFNSSDNLPSILQ